VNKFFFRKRKKKQKIIETDGGKVKGYSFILIVIVTTKMAMVNTANKSESAVYFS